MTRALKSLVRVPHSVPKPSDLKIILLIMFQAYRDQMVEERKMILIICHSDNNLLWRFTRQIP